MCIYDTYDTNWDVGDIKRIDWSITDWNGLRINDFDNKINTIPMGNGNIITNCDILWFNPYRGEHITQVMAMVGSCDPSCPYNNDGGVRGIWMISNFGYTYKCIGNLDDKMHMKTFNAEKLLTSNGFIEFVSFSGKSNKILNGFYVEFRVYSSIYQLIVRHPWTYFLNKPDQIVDFKSQNTNKPLYIYFYTKFVYFI